MLPDLRIVIAAVVSTFICTVGVGFYASTRLLQEPFLARPDPHDDTPINRIALNWPEPVQIDRSLSLDFAVTAKAAKNPVRDVTAETSPTQAEAIAKLSAAPARRPVTAPAAEPAPVNVAADSTSDKPADAAPDKIALSNIPLVEPDPHRLIVPEQVAIAPSLVEPDPHRIFADPQITGSVAETPQPMTPREALQKVASRPDSADPSPDDPAADAATTGEQPAVKVRIVKEPTAGKPRAKRKARAAPATNPPNTDAMTRPVVRTLSDLPKQLQFPFLWFQIPQL